MGIERKKLVKQEKKKPEVVQTGKKLKRGFDTSSLPDAIVDGKFLAEVGSQVIVSRNRGGKNTLSICKINKVNDELVHTFDETVEQFFTFSIKQPPETVKLLK